MRHDMQPHVWSDHAGRRVLIEAGDWARQESLTGVLQRSGYQTTTCDGPESSDSRCTLVGTGECDACRDADVIVHLLRHSDPRNREVLLNLRSHYPDTPIIVEVPGPRAERYPSDFDRCTVIPQPMTAQSLLAAIADALTSPAAES